MMMIRRCGTTSKTLASSLGAVVALQRRQQQRALVSIAVTAAESTQRRRSRFLLSEITATTSLDSNIPFPCVSTTTAVEIPSLSSSCSSSFFPVKNILRLQQQQQIVSIRSFSSVSVNPAEAAFSALSPFSSTLLEEEKEININSSFTITENVMERIRLAATQSRASSTAVLDDDDDDDDYHDHEVEHVETTTVGGETVTATSLKATSETTTTKTTKCGNNPTKSSSSSTSNSNVHGDDKQSGNEYDLLLKDLERAAAWNHQKGGGGKQRLNPKLWEPEFCQTVVNRYDAFLQQQLKQRQLQPQQQQPQKKQRRKNSAATPSSSSATSTDHDNEEAKKKVVGAELLSDRAVVNALKALLKSRRTAQELSPLVRAWERIVGQLNQTPFTDHVSLRFLTAHAKAGNVSSVLRLLQLRQQKQFRPRPREFWYAVTSLQVAPALHNRHRSHRNPYMRESQLTLLERNPTRWLDAILINMKERNVPLDTKLCNHMLACFATTGYSGKVTHHFYRTKRVPINRSSDSENDGNEEQDKDNNDGDTSFSADSDNRLLSQQHQQQQNKKYKIRLDYNPKPLPFGKRPSDVRNVRELRLKEERDPRFSETLAAAFSFADSLQHHGACGHDPVPFDTVSYNTLLQACCKHGALWRAMQLIDHIMPNNNTNNSNSNDNNCQPDTFSYGILFKALARVGDVPMMQEYYYKMLSQSSKIAASSSSDDEEDNTKRQKKYSDCKLDEFIVRELANGYLNYGDIPGAISIVQDCFHQHHVLPPYTTHLKLLEFCLATDLVHEAKRYVYFLQELWRWQPNQYCNAPETIRLIRATQQRKELQKPALEKMFHYFGETLEDSDFL